MVAEVGGLIDSSRTNIQILTVLWNNENTMVTMARKQLYLSIQLKRRMHLPHFCKFFL